jgi:hypothetical protein
MAASCCCGRSDNPYAEMEPPSRDRSSVWAARTAAWLRIARGQRTSRLTLICRRHVRRIDAALAGSDEPQVPRWTFSTSTALIANPRPPKRTRVSRPGSWRGSKGPRRRGIPIAERQIRIPTGWSDPLGPRDGIGPARIRIGAPRRMNGSLIRVAVRPIRTCPGTSSEPPRSGQPASPSSRSVGPYAGCSGRVS